MVDIVNRAYAVSKAKQIVDGSEEGTSGYYMYLPVKMKRSNTKDSVTISVPAFADAFGLTAFSWSRVVGLDIHFAYRST